MKKNKVTLMIIDLNIGNNKPRIQLYDQLNIPPSLSYQYNQILINCFN